MTITRDPLASVVDAPLFIVPRVLDGLRAYRTALAPQHTRLKAELDDLVGCLLDVVERQPTKFWVMRQFQRTLEATDDADAATRAQLRKELEHLMDILGIESSDGVLGCDNR